MKGLIIKKNAGLFDVDTGAAVIKLKASGNVKKQGVYVGDYVEFEEVITKIDERKNFLIRPPLSNLDKLFIVLAPIPKPDFVLIDKLIIYAKVKGIEPLLVINKTDIIDESVLDEIKNIYTSVLKVILVSAEQKEVQDLKKEIKGICAFAGQSAVGKSSLINALLGNANAEVGELSKKVERGKQTTRMTSLYKCGKG